MLLKVPVLSWRLNAGSPGGDFRGFSYVLAPQGVRPGDQISTGPASTIRPGNTLPLSAMPIGQEVSCHIPFACVHGCPSRKLDSS